MSKEQGKGNNQLLCFHEHGISLKQKRKGHKEFWMEIEKMNSRKLARRNYCKPFELWGCFKAKYFIFILSFLQIQPKELSSCLNSITKSCKYNTLSGSTGQQGPFLGLNTSTEACQLEAQVRILGFTNYFYSNNFTF